jgi:threonine dehydratase
MKRRLKGSIRTIWSTSDRYAPKTPLTKIVQLCGRYKCDNVYVKDESKNRHGTFKDRRNDALLRQHAPREIVIFVHITNGNSGYSLGQYVQASSKAYCERPVVNVIDRKTPKKIKEMLESCSDVVEMDLSKGLVTDDELRKIARKVTEYEGPEDNIVVVENYRFKDGYGKIVHEIKEQLDREGKKPDYIFCPVGGGELASEIAREAEVIWGEDAPKIIGVTLPQNVIMHVKEFIRKVRSSIADKISCGYSKFKDLVKNFVESGRIELTTVKEGEIVKEYKYLNGIGINVEPSAAVAFVGAAKYELKPDDVVVVINSGKGIYDQKKVERTWARKLKKAVVYAAFGILGAVIAMGGAYSYALHRLGERGIMIKEAYTHAEKAAKIEGLENQPYSHLVCALLVKKKEDGYKLSETQIKEICEDIGPSQISDAHLRFYNEYSRWAEGTRDLIVSKIMYDAERRYQEGYYEDDFRAKYGRFKQWLSDTFNEYKRKDVIRFYFPEYECWNSDDYRRCMRHYSTWKPPEIVLKKKE